MYHATMESRRPILRGITLTLTVAVAFTLICIFLEEVYYGEIRSQVQSRSSTQGLAYKSKGGIGATDARQIDLNISTPATCERHIQFNLTESKITQERRQDQLRKVCLNYYQTEPLDMQRNPAKALQLLDKRFHRTYFNDDFKFMFSYIFKIGSSNWKPIFRTLHKKSSWEFQKRQRDALWSLQSTVNFPKSNKQLIARLLNFTKVVFVRHPLSRLLSAYREKFIKYPTLYYREKARQIIGVERGKRVVKRKTPDVTFREFVDFITNDKLGFLAQDEHWSTIVDRYRPCENYFNFIGHLETVNKDTNYLFKLLQINDIVSFDESSHPTQSSRKLLLRKYYSQLSVTMFKKIVLRYEDDFRVFGYHIPQNASDL